MGHLQCELLFKAFDADEEPDGQRRGDEEVAFRNEAFVKTDQRLI